MTVRAADRFFRGLTISCLAVADAGERETNLLCYTDAHTIYPASEKENVFDSSGGGAHVRVVVFFRARSRRQLVFSLALLAPA